MSISTNVVSVIFGNSRRACGDRILHQRDRGQILTFPDLADQLPSTFQVWFANHPEIGTAVPQTGSGGNVAIPDTLVATGQPIWAWLYLHTGADDGETCYTVTILNTAQPAFTGATPTPAQASAWDEAIDAMNAAIEAAEAAANHGPQIVNGFWYTWDAAAGEYVNTNVPAEGEDGADGNSIWWTVSLINDESMPDLVLGKIRSSWLKGRSGTPAVHDLVVGPAVGTSRNIEWLYEIIAVSGIYCNLKGIGSIKGAPGTPGEDGYSPVVTITEIEGGHRVTITDEDHPQGQSFDVLDGQGGSGSSDYDDLSNKPQIAGVTLSGNKSLADLGIAAASDIPTVPVQSVNGKTGAVVLNASDVGAGTYTKPSGGIPKTDLASAVQTSLGKADTALQTAPVTSVNGQTGAVTLSIPSTAADVGAIAAPASPSSAQDLVYLNGAWVAADKLYIVNCTPTALDYSGTIDKTPAQIEAAIQEGKDLLFRIYTGVSEWYDVPWTRVNYSSGNFTVVSFYFVAQTSSGDMLIFGETAPDTQTYNTVIYPLSRTPCIPAPASPTTGDFLCWNGSAWAATTLSAWQGGNYGS